MDPKNRTVRIFVSSTFRDMHAERDHLVTVVFPELRERMALLGLEFFDVDLRWGVPEYSADGEKANSWQYCKQWIDRVEPFFISILGERYGWVPQTEQIQDAEDRKTWSNLSITEMEIRYAVLDQTKFRRRSYFYFRRPKVPRPPATHKRIFREFVDIDRTESLASLKNRINRCGRPVRYYPCTWNRDQFEELDEFGELVLEDLWSGILRDSSFVDIEAWTVVLGRNFEKNPIFFDKSKPVPSDIWNRIVEHARPAPKDPLDIEAQEMEDFAENRLRWFKGRSKELDQLHRFVNESRSGHLSGICVVKASSGIGKSTLLAKFSQEISISKRNSEYILFTHFVDATDGSTNVRLLLQRLIRELDRNGVDVPMDLDMTLEGQNLRHILAESLRTYSGTRRLVIIIDGVNQLSDGHDLQWLPHVLGENVRIIISCVDDPYMDADTAEARVLLALRSKVANPEWLDVTPLENTDIREITIEYLREYCKELDQTTIDDICSMSAAGTPLYLLVMLNELRTLGGNEMNEKVPRIIAQMEERYPDTKSLFNWVLQQLEVFGAQAVGYWCAYLSLGRQGLSSRELRTLVAQKLGAEQEKTALRIERGLRRYLQKRGMQLDFFHGQINAAVTERYLKTNKILAADAASLHRDISKYFDSCWQEPNLHALSELTYHQSRAAEWNKFTTTLTNLSFLEAKIRGLGPSALIEDFDAAFEPIISPGISLADQEALRRLQRALHLSVNTLKNDPAQLRTHLLGRLASSDGKCIVPLLATARQMKTSTFLVPKTNSLMAPGGSLQCTLVFPEVPSDLFLLSDNQHVVVHTRKKIYLLDVSRGEILHEFYGLEHGVSGYRVSADQIYLAGVSADGVFRKWEINTGEVVLSVPIPLDKYSTASTGHPVDRYRQKPIAFRQTAFSANLKILAGSLDDPNPMLLIWDIERGKELFNLIGHTSTISALDMTSDGNYAVSGDNNGMVIIWDLISGEKLAQIDTIIESVHRVHLISRSQVVIIQRWAGEQELYKLKTRELVHFPEKRYRYFAASSRANVFVAAAANGQIDVFELTSGQRQMTLAGHRRLSDSSPPVQAVTLNQDGKKALSAALDRTVKIWDLESGKLHHTLAGHEGYLSDVVIGNDNRTVISACNRGRLYIWDLAKARQKKTTVAHSDSVWTLRLTADRRQVVSGSHDATMIVWDINTGQPVRRLKGHDWGRIEALCFTRSGLAISGSDEPIIRIWELATGKQCHTLKGHKNKVMAVLVNPEEDLVFSGSRDGHVKIWDLSTGKLLHSIQVYEDWVSTMLLTPDGKQLITGSREGELTLHNIGTDMQAQSFENNSKHIRDLAITADGKNLIVATDDSYILIWSLPDRRLQKTMKRRGRGVWQLTHLTQTGLFASCGLDGSLLVWDFKTGRLHRTLCENGPSIRAISLAPEGDRVISASDENCTIWDVATGEMLACFVGDTSMTGCLSINDSEFVLAERSGRIHFVAMSPDRT